MKIRSARRHLQFPLTSATVRLNASSVYLALGKISPQTAASLPGCITTRQAVTQSEDNLAAAGFVIRPANTPERQAMLNRLPPHSFVKRVHGDTVHYVYADPLVRDCLYVGTQEAYSQYKRYLQQTNLEDEQETTAQMYSDPAWSWGAWGPWAPGYGYSVPGSMHFPTAGNGLAESDFQFQVMAG
jgi:hypothetical protein